MVPNKADTEADNLNDRGEQIPLMEPLPLSDRAKSQEGILDLALDLTAKSAGFSRSLPPAILTSLADLVRSINCYYSNLIEGHDTHPIDIERALKNDYSQDQKKRDLQIEAKAHIDVQRWIDQGALKGALAFTVEGLREVHRRFCAALPEELLWVEDPSTKERARVVPGNLRRLDVKVGTHIAISPRALPRFLSRFEQVYSRAGKTDSILAVAAAHHRLLSMHPFLDGNGRVARLLSHATLLELMDTRSIWSVARGLARKCGMLQRATGELRLAPSQRSRRSRNSQPGGACGLHMLLPGNGIDQIEFMEGLLQPARLRARILQWAEAETRIGALPAKATSLLEAILYRGELPRGEADAVLGVGDRQARRIIATLIDRQVLVSENPRAPLRLAFPATLAALWMPGLFPDFELP